MAESNVRPRPTTWATAPNRRIVVGSNTLVYRDLGPENGVPLVLLTHLGATLDEWDPRFVDALARDRRIVALDLPGVGGSTGRVPGTVAAMARAAEGFVAALGLTQMDLLGFSLGGFVAQQVALDAPGLVRRLVLAGTGPAGEPASTVRRVEPTSTGTWLVPRWPAPMPRSSCSFPALQRARRQPRLTSCACASA
ncbi:alpha/beta fold hydrolase [Streptomyces sp. NBC_00162]|uniref:alpha/beta fold hydrolase n=1 Tax=Streptomyces sp. NBC_00162 TaxID=2903629 RepID=UPI00214C4433|nr:alpha/beta fold hydrolase [Streptomyces sp. NBC_00162]UUU37695.1 alpha/beta fold hydrolase [Streptomyces sp. NBC_00162]